MTQPAGPMPQEQRTSQGLPVWALVLWWVLCAVGAIAGWWFVLLMVTFGCDSGWEGCETVGITTVFVYAGLAGVGLLALLLWALLRPTTGVHIAAFLLMPFWVVLSMVLAFAGYLFFADRAVSG